MKSKEEIKKEIQDVEKRILLTRADNTLPIRPEGADILEREYSAVKNALEWVLGEDEGSEVTQMHKEFKAWHRGYEADSIGDLKDSIFYGCWKAAWKRSRELLAEDKEELADYRDYLAAEDQANKGG